VVGVSDGYERESGATVHFQSGKVSNTVFTDRKGYYAADLPLGDYRMTVVSPVLEWKGWHAYRCGLATNLHELGVPDKVIQAILRHEDVSTTQRSYIKTVPQVVTDAMNQLEARIARAAIVQQVAVHCSVNF
jgi:integrase